MFQRKKLSAAEPPEKPELLGLHLAVKLPGGSAVDLKLSEQTAGKLAPGLVILLIAMLGSTGLWFGFKHLPQLATTSQPTGAEIQPQK